MINNVYENFSYMDQLKDVEINLTEYLKEFSDNDYTLKFNNRQPAIVTLANIFERYTVVEDFKDKNASFTIYNIRESELPEDISLKYYQSEDFWWVILIFNDIKNPLTEWPLSQEQIDYLVDAYATLENKYTRDAYYNLIFDWNENRRRIEVLNANQLNDFIQQFRQEVISQTTDDRYSILL